MTVNPDTIAETNPDIVEAVTQAGLDDHATGDSTDSRDGKNGQPPEDGKKEKRESQADLLVKIVEDSGAEFFHTPTDEQFIRFTIASHNETWPIRSKATRRWITNRFYRATRKAPNNEAMQSALNVLEAKGSCEGNEQEVYLRAAWHDGALCYDLADADWRIVRIDAQGWEVIADSRVPFRRYSNTLPQAEPIHGGNLAMIWDFINVKEEAD